jgi:hypothetical protein
MQALGEEWPLKRRKKVLGNTQGMGGNLKRVCGPPLWSSGQSFWLLTRVPGSIPGVARFF